MSDLSFGKTIPLVVAINSVELKQNANQSDNQPRDIQRVLTSQNRNSGSSSCGSQKVMYFPLANVGENSASVIAYDLLHSYQYYLTKRET